MEHSPVAKLKEKSAKAAMKNLASLKEQKDQFVWGDLKAKEGHVNDES